MFLNDVCGFDRIIEQFLAPFKIMRLKRKIFRIAGLAEWSHDANPRVCVNEGGDMPKQLTDEQILGVIESVRQQNERVTGLAVRTELRRLYGVPGGVDRIYRLINEPTSVVLPGIQDELRDEIAVLKQQLAAAVRRAELAEHREQAHQEKWAMEIDQLRQQLRAVQIDTRKLSDAQNQVLELRRELHRLSNGA